MPSKIQLDENLWFLYICLQKSDLKTIDFNAVGVATSLKPPAARMRYTRLRRQIESGSLNIAHNPAVSSSPPPPSSPSLQTANESSSNPAMKRTRGKKAENTTSPSTFSSTATTTSSTATTTSSTATTTSTIPLKSELPNPQPSQLNHSSQPPTQTHPTSTDTITGSVPPSHPAQIQPKQEPAQPSQPLKIKLENHSGSDADADFDSDSAEDEDSEDEMPLAKLRYRRALGVGAGVGLLPPSGQSPSRDLVKPEQQGYSTFASEPARPFTHGASGLGDGRPHMMERPRYVQQGFSTQASDRGNGPRRGGFDGRGCGGHFSGGANRRGLYASPYAGWIDGRSHEDRMGNPGPGWENRARVPEQRFDIQRHEHERAVVGSEVPKKSV